MDGLESIPPRVQFVPDRSRRGHLRVNFVGVAPKASGREPHRYVFDGQELATVVEPELVSRLQRLRCDEHDRVWTRRARRWSTIRAQCVGVRRRPRMRGSGIPGQVEVHRPTQDVGRTARRWMVDHLADGKRIQPTDLVAVSTMIGRGHGGVVASEHAAEAFAERPRIRPCRLDPGVVPYLEAGDSSVKSVIVEGVLNNRYFDARPQTVDAHATKPSNDV
mmetsp:Transcript_114430/g.323503  ORF Transcript_114430/g.323503 Transcript_114430/m.323503 type:complete len:220 (-) Transcript_114430:607-1266(-)